MNCRILLIINLLSQRWEKSGPQAGVRAPRCPSGLVSPASLGLLAIPGTHTCATVAARLPREHWPQQPVLITAVDAQSGEPVVFDRESGIELVEAIAASCSSGSACRSGNRQYI